MLLADPLGMLDIAFKHHGDGALDLFETGFDGSVLLDEYGVARWRKFDNEEP